MRTAYTDGFGTAVRIYDEVVCIVIHKVGSSGYRHAELAVGEVIHISPMKVKVRINDDQIATVWQRKTKLTKRKEEV